MLFCGSERSNCHITMLLPCLFNESSSKPLFTYPALEEAPLTNKANLQNAFKNRAGTDEQGLCEKTDLSG